MAGRQRLNARKETLLLGAAGAVETLQRDRLHGRQHIFDAVIELLDEQRLRLFGLLALGDVERQAGEETGCPFSPATKRPWSRTQRMAPSRRLMRNSAS